MRQPCCIVGGVMRLLGLIGALALAACSGGKPVPTRAASTAEAQLLASKPQFPSASALRPTRANSEMAADFLDLSFRMESGRAIPRLTRFEGPVSVRTAGDVSGQMLSDLRALLDRLRKEAGLDVFLTGAPEAAITIEAIPRAKLQRAVPGAACFVVPRVAGWTDYLANRRTPVIDWTTLDRRDKASVFVPSDASPQEVRDCLHEELAQALGPLNDLYRLPDSVFNDDNIHAVLTGFDMLMLRAYYAPELRNGMTRGEVAARLPAILARLNPAGTAAPGRPVTGTSRDWITAMETALSSAPSTATRRRASERALNLSRALGYSDARHGFSHYAFGRLQVGNNTALALAAFQRADRIFAHSRTMRLHQAHVAVQLAAFHLSRGDAQAAITLTSQAEPVALAHHNAALAATLRLIRAEAFDLTGRPAAAQALRLDTRDLARYGFGGARQVSAQMREIAALSPRH